ncbi:MAG: hypothetical protein WC581_14395 [Thermodesulfovibrionales bacterium]
MTDEDYERGYNDGKGNKNSGCLGVIIGIIILWIVIVKWGWNVPLLQNLFKYEGRTAEEWFNQSDYWNGKYTSFRTCVEDYDSFDIKTQIEYGGVFYYCE